MKGLSMDRFAIEIFRIGGEKLLQAAHKEFKSFFIVARTQEYVVLGNGEKNVSFSRKNFRVLERTNFEKTRNLQRKKL
jgi:AICAR transformylase/IMP cyclohydrolase PurH